ncbi:MAG: hypothetical protein OXB84_01040, partial [Halobacteriovoraceae bacterium]|nr:hypothetical protein [Halobacteriovoraceae bacterium]
LYFLHGSLGRSSIVVSDELFKLLSTDELKNLLYQALSMIKKREAHLRMRANFLFIPFCLLFSRYKKGNTGYLQMIVSFFLLPLSILRDNVLKWREADTDWLKNKDILSAFLKIRKTNTSFEKSILEDVMKNFAVIPNNNDRLISSLVDKDIFKQVSLF